MKVEGGELMLRVLNKQFEMIGEKLCFEDIPEDGKITVNGKKDYWYNHYKFENIEQYEVWKKWAYEQMKILGETQCEYVMRYLDFRYGMVYRYKKEGTLF